jgi:hypothetical protein
VAAHKAALATKADIAERDLPKTKLASAPKCGILPTSWCKVGNRTAQTPSLEFKQTLEAMAREWESIAKREARSGGSRRQAHIR